MNIILGASGQIGSMLVDNLLKDGQAVRAVVRSFEKGQALADKGIETATADFNDAESLTAAFQGGNTVFLLTPEDPERSDFLGETRLILDNYRKAILSTGISRIVGLSSMGAQHKTGTGNLEASYMLEHCFEGIGAEKVFVRPAYYFSNWLGYLDLVIKQGVLPTFFPPDMPVQMIAPPDAAAFLAGVMEGTPQGETLYEITGPREYSALEIAEIFEEVLERKVSVQHIPQEEWEEAFLQAGFSGDAARNFKLMTKAVVDGKTRNDAVVPIRLETDFKEYLKSICHK